MKIAQIIHNYSTGDGMSDVVRTLSEELERQGHEVTILYKKSSRGIFNSKVKTRKSSFIGMLSYIRKNGIDLVHTHFGKGTLYGNLIKLLTKTKHIFTYHALAPNDMGTSQKFNTNLFFHKTIFKMGLIDEFVVISNFVRKELKNWYGIKNSTVIYNGINTKRFKKKEPKIYSKNKNKNEIYIGYLSAFDINKNQKLLIEIMKDLPSNVKLILGGSGDTKEDCKELTNSLNLNDRVLFVGFVPEEDKVDFYNSCDIFAFPSLWEGFGLPAVEAMSCEVPVIVMNKASLPEIIQFGGGFAASNKKDFLEKINILLDEKRRSKLGKDARKAVLKNFDIKKQAKKYIELVN